MSRTEFLRRAHCSECDWYAVWGPSEVANELLQLGHLRRDAQPEPEIVQQLLLSVLPAIICPDCHATGISLTSLDDIDEAWGDARKCEICQAIIPPERVEIFPQVTRCVKCQDKPAPASSEDDYCPRCGSLVRIRAVQAGVTRYIISCASCGYRS